MKRKRAMSLYAVLVIVSVAALMVSTMAALYVTNLQFSMAANNGEMAHIEAETALQEALARIVYQSDFGSKDECVGVPSKPGDGRDRWHQLSYAANAVKRSLYSDTTGQSHVYAVGYCRGQYRVLEAVIQPAQYNYALATEGTITSSTRFTTRGVADSSKPSVTNRPGNVLTNGDVSFQGNVDISGSLRLAGRLAQVPNPPDSWIVSGGIEQGLARRSLPKLSLAEVDGQLPPENLQIPIITDTIPDPEFTCLTALKRTGDVIFAGELKLQQGAIRVHAGEGKPGSLTVLGRLSGNGLLITDGDVIIERADMESSGQIIVVAGGRVHVKKGFFRGLVYSQTHLQLNNCTVLGTAVVSPASAKQAGISYGAEVEETDVLADPNAGHFEATVDTYSGLKQGKGDAPFMLNGMYDSAGNPAKSAEQVLNDAINSGDISGLEFDPAYPAAWTWDPEAKGIYQSLSDLKKLMDDLKKLREDLKAAQDAEAAATEPAEKAARAEDTDRAADAVSKLEKQMKESANNLEKDYQAYKNGHATAGGGVAGKDGKKKSYPVTFDLQKFLARSEAVRTIYYKEHANQKF
ncbi:MAG: hypothetical protein KF760_11235 [Candidatus Eremiobacteraeota bacterium]|nr:hypothetical protein [Candidatus Eremiobacteraeota bacterium]MCW5870625.1 hypothetical protein [Candidatus Eremiobacteraeota bacterium]